MTNQTELSTYKVVGFKHNDNTIYDVVYFNHKAEAKSWLDFNQNLSIFKCYDVMEICKLKEKLPTLEDRFEGIVLISEKKVFIQKAEAMLYDFEQEGFDKEDSKEYLCSLINKL